MKQIQKPTLALFKWGNDRFNTGYKILTLAYIKGILDIYLFRYSTNSHLPKHKDPNKFGRQYRLNIVLWKPDKGGQFWCKGDHFNFKDRIIFFRADSCYHGMTKIEQGTRMILSIGFYRPHK